MSDINQLAANKARIKRSILDLLAELPDEYAQADVLADLTLMLTAGEVESSPDKPTKKKPKVTKTTAAPRKGGKVTKGLRPGTKATTLHAFLEGRPQASFGEMAKAVYNTDSNQAVRGVRAILNSLSKQGLVKQVSYGKWETT